jgi:hypothetical protein
VPIVGEGRDGNGTLTMDDEHWLPATPGGENGTDTCAEPDAVGTFVDGKE